MADAEKYITDANFNLHILAGLRRRQPSVDVLTARQLQLLDMPDPEVLLAAKEHGRILLTHDRKTMPDYLEALLRPLPPGEHIQG